MRRSIITLTPLIDVVFILLVFFMLASSFMEWRVLELGLSKSGGGSGQGALLLEVGVNDIRLSGRPLGMKNLKPLLLAAFQETPDLAVMVKPLPGVDLQRTIQLVDRITAAGGKNVSFLDAGGR